MVRLSRSLTCIVVISIYLGIGVALAGQPVGRILRTEALPSGGVRLFVSFLDERNHVLGLDDQVESLSVRAQYGAKSEFLLERFVEQAPTKSDKSTVNIFSESDVPLDMVLIVSGNEDEARTSLLNDDLREAASLVLKELPASSRANLLWLNDEVFAGNLLDKQGGSLAAYWDDNLREDCAQQDEPYFSIRAKKGAKKAEHPCGLLSDTAPLLSALTSGGDTNISGHYPPLFGLPWVSCEGVSRSIKHQYERKVGVGGSGEETFERMKQTGAVDIAIQMLSQYGRDEAFRTIFMITDGKDGYTLASEDCREKIVDACAQQHPKPRRKRGRAYRKWRRAHRACIRETLRNQIPRQQQQLFMQKVRTILPAMRAGGIRMDSVLLPTAEDFETDRLRLLSIQSGGNFRLVEREKDLVVDTEAALMELLGAFVVDIYPQGKRTLPEGETVTLFVQIEVPTESGESLEIRTDEIQYLVPTPDRSLSAKFQRFRAWLTGKLGPTGATIVLIVIGLLLAFLCFKLFAKIFKGIKGKLQKAKKNAKKKAKEGVKG